LSKNRQEILATPAPRHHSRPEKIGPIRVRQPRVRWDAGVGRFLSEATHSRADVVVLPPQDGSEPSPGSRAHFKILVTRPAPTVRPPSRIANRSPSSIAIGWINVTTISVLSPGMHISVPSGNSIEPVTSVVRK
jgi:hypothetical protein